MPNKNENNNSCIPIFDYMVNNCDEFTISIEGSDDGNI